MTYLNVGTKCWCHHNETSYLFKSAAVPQQELGWFSHPKIRLSLRKGTNNAHTEGESIAGDSGEGHSPPIESLCPVLVVNIHLAHHFSQSVDTIDSRIPMKAHLSWVRLGSWGGASRKEEPSGTALPLLMIVLLEVPWNAWGFGLRRTGRDTTEHSTLGSKVG